MKGKKSLEYRLQVALRVAQLDPNARVLYVCGNVHRAKEVWHTLINLVGKPNGFSYNVIHKEARHENGGVFTVRAPDPVYNGGEHGTHMWMDETVGWRMHQLMSTKLRSPYPIGPEPMGIYDEYGVTRREDY